MAYAEYAPDARLSSWVKCLWTLVDEPSEEVQEVWPDGCVELVCSPGNVVRLHSEGTTAPLAPAAVLGIQTEIMRVRTEGPVRLAVARLLPVGMPAWNVALLEELGATMQPLLHTEELEPAVRALESWLLAHRPADVELSETLRRLVAVHGNMSVAAMASARGVSVRQLQRELAAQLGVTPKALASVLRFAQSWSVLLREPEISLAELAVELGYYDQAHLTHAFSTLGGESPARFAQQWAGTSRSYKKH